jgi:hypothetical protein
VWRLHGNVAAAGRLGPQRAGGRSQSSETLLVARQRPGRRCLGGQQPPHLHLHPLPPAPCPPSGKAKAQGGKPGREERRAAAAAARQQQADLELLMMDDGALLDAAKGVGGWRAAGGWRLAAGGWRRRPVDGG